ncbi:MAG: hypothetical protein MUE69_22610 [Myxococcota bacterium]|jgi:hypothetical protein|nr:hypothetical protein [Myxococcota bacterium]
MREVVYELIVGLGLVAVGFAVSWLFGEEWSATTAWLVGVSVVGGGGVAVLATRETLRKRREKRG